MKPKRHRTILAALIAAAAWTSGTARALTQVYIEDGTALLYMKGYTTPDPSWIQPSYQEGAEWIASVQGFGIGYGDGDDNTELADMSGGYLTVYVRAHFNVGAELGQLTAMELVAWFDDGFVAYLNGQEVARSNVPAGPLGADDPATGHEVTDGAFTISLDPSLLVQGLNVFSVEVHNSSLTSSDLSFRPTLTAWDTPPPDAAITRGPFLQQMDRTSVLVVWETDQPVESTLIYGSSQTMDRTVQDSDPKMRHVLLLADLDPASEHFYQVQSARVPSLMGRFVTEMNRADPFRVAVYGDTRSNHDDHRAVMRQLEMEQAHLALHTGDLVGDGSLPSQYDTYFDIEAGLLLNVTQYPALGNHEGSGDLYLDLFELPPNSPSAERYYWVHYATVFFAVMDQYGSAYDAGSPQYTWLDQTLDEASQNPDVRHILVLMHHGPYDSGSHGSNMTVRNDLVPLFEQYGVDMVFSGHDHNYERGTVNDVKYVVTGGGGAPLYSVSGDWWTEAFETVLHYCILAIHGPRLEFTAKRVDGSELDSFVLGDSVSECQSPADCAQMAHNDCGPGETGEWVCVLGGCIWNCFVEPVTDPDGGVLPDGGGGTDGSVEPDASGGNGGSTRGGCGCRHIQQAGSRNRTRDGTPSPILIMLLAAALAAIRRRRARPDSRHGS